jgi:hypothetical protein
MKPRGCYATQASETDHNAGCAWLKHPHCLRQGQSHHQPNECSKRSHALRLSSGRQSRLGDGCPEQHHLVHVRSHERAVHSDGPAGPRRLAHVRSERGAPAGNQSIRADSQTTRGTVFSPADITPDRGFPVLANAARAEFCAMVFAAITIRAGSVLRISERFQTHRKRTQAIGARFV